MGIKAKGVEHFFLTLFPVYTIAVKISFFTAHIVTDYVFSGRKWDIMFYSYFMWGIGVTRLGIP